MFGDVANAGVILVGALAWVVAWLVGVYRDPQLVAWNARALPEAMARWRRSVVCMRCGEVTDPATAA